jgi:hypothetical protein
MRIDMQQDSNTRRKWRALVNLRAQTRSMGGDYQRTSSLLYPRRQAQGGLNALRGMDVL